MVKSSKVVKIESKTNAVLIRCSDPKKTLVRKTNNQTNHPLDHPKFFPKTWVSDKVSHLPCRIQSNQRDNRVIAC